MAEEINDIGFPIDNQWGFFLSIIIIHNFGKKMILSGKRIFNLKKHLRFIRQGTEIIIGLADIEKYSEKLILAGFSSNLGFGETILPNPKFGSISNYNANGGYIAHKDKPKETCYRHAEWTWKQWNGRYDTEEKSKIVSIPYERYQRSLIHPPSIEISISQSINGQKLLSTPAILYSNENEKHILHAINLFLEIFGECSIFDNNLTNIVHTPIRRLNWDILPPGKRIWKEVNKDISEIVKSAPKGNQSAILYKLERINSHQPNFIAIGRAGFKGYVIFGFESNNLFILESVYEGNATYVFRNDWEFLSQLTKAEIINQSLQEDRIIHRNNWNSRIKSYLNSYEVKILS